MPIYDTFLTLSGVSEIKKYVLKEINNVIQKAIDQSLSLFFFLFLTLPLLDLGYRQGQPYIFS